MEELLTLISLSAGFVSAVLGSSSKRITKADYLDLIKRASEHNWKRYSEQYEKWEKSDPRRRSENPPSLHLYWARLDGLLYEVTKEEKYAEQARKILLEADSDNYYTIKIIRQIKDSGVLSKEDLKILDKKIIEAAERALQYWIEWGAMNHCTNHIVNSLTATMAYFPDHPDCAKWQQKRDINLSSSWGLWSIEDSQNYIPTWLKPLIEYAELTGREKEFYEMPTTKYYFDYMVQLMTPEGEIVEFGDGGPGSQYTYPWYISCLEKGATIYRDGKMKWAAHRLFEANVLEKGRETYGAQDLVEAYLWADDSVQEEVPSGGSRQVLEDHVGKKIAFRSGWDSQATYLFLNYRDVAWFGSDGKEHMRTTINVETEKTHHGHADENAICMLMKDGAVLLHESGYRESWVTGTGPDGQFRADVFHNKLVVRNGLADAQSRLLPFLLDGGRYRFVETRLMHFRTFKEVDISRTRLIDKERGYQWDRLINYLKGKEWFVIFDIVKLLKDGPFTFANLFYTQDIVDHDLDNPSWFDTRYQTLAADQSDPNPTHMNLLIYFPDHEGTRIGTEQIRRCYQEERAVYQAKVDEFPAGSVLIFNTFLIPHGRSQKAQEIIATLSILKIFHTERGYGVQIPTEKGYIQLNAMLDLEAEYLKENIRPRYNFESGRAEYGDIVTDARYCYSRKMKNTLHYAFFKASKILYNRKMIFEAPSIPVGQDDGTHQKMGVPKWIAWEESVDLK